VTLTFTPIATDAGTYEVPENSILCNGMAIVNAAVTGTTTLAALVIQLNTLAGTKDMGTWAVAGVTTITLVGTACSDVNIPWQVD
jgi:hypothetical protein